MTQLATVALLQPAPTALEKEIESLMAEHISRRGLSARTQIDMRSRLGVFCRWVRYGLEIADCKKVSAEARAERDLLRSQCTTVESISGDILGAYRDDLLASGKSAATVHSYCSAIRMMMATSQALGGRAQSLVLFRTPPVDHSKHKREALTAAEAERLRTCAHDMGPRTSAIVALGLAGLRTVEIATLRLCDCDLSRQRVHVLGKMRHEREWASLPVFAVRAVFDLVSTYPADEPENAPLIRSHTGAAVSALLVQNEIRAALLAAGLKRPGVCPHSLRHTAATLALTAGAPVEGVSKLLRHRELATTQVYLHDLDARAAQAASALDTIFTPGV